MPRHKKGKRPFKPNYRDNYWQTESYNQALFQVMRDDILQIALSRFKWVNLPKTCDERYLEYTLLTEGAATIAFPKGKPEAILSLRVMQQKGPNMYDNPKTWRAIGQTGETDFPCDWSNGVWIWDNVTRYPLMTKINIWARELADIIRAKQINRFHTRMPVVISGASEHEFDMQNILKQISQGEPAIITTNGIDNIDVHVWSTGVEYLGKDFTEEWQNTWNIVYHELGIETVPFASERRVTSEVDTYKDQNAISGMSSLDMRRAAATKFCDRFGEYLPDGPFYPVINRDNITDNYDALHRIDTFLDMEGGDKAK